MLTRGVINIIKGHFPFVVARTLVLPLQRMSWPLCIALQIPGRLISMPSNLEKISQHLGPKVSLPPFLAARPETLVPRALPATDSYLMLISGSQS